MAKGQMRSNREAKKPKQEKKLPAAPGAAGSRTAMPAPAKKK